MLLQTMAGQTAENEGAVCPAFIIGNKQRSFANTIYKPLTFPNLIKMVH